MGHANLSNLSDFFVRRLFAKGKLTIHDCVQAMLKKKVTYNASEGHTPLSKADPNIVEATIDDMVNEPEYNDYESYQ